MLAPSDQILQPLSQNGFESRFVLRLRFHHIRNNPGESLPMTFRQEQSPHPLPVSRPLGLQFLKGVETRALSAPFFTEGAQVPVLLFQACFHGLLEFRQFGNPLHKLGLRLRMKFQLVLKFFRTLPRLCKSCMQALSFAMIPLRPFLEHVEPFGSGSSLVAALGNMRQDVEQIASPLLYM